jgi:ABC-type sugar transport system ATPase subunit
MVFQSYALYPHMTVGQNIAYPLKKRGMAKAARMAKVAEAAELLQLTDLLERRPKQLSGGQQQRVALGRALVRDPEVFLLDEPLSNLDAKLRAYMRAELIELHRRLGRTMIYVTHDQLEAMTMSQRIAVMNGGRLQQLGTPDAVYNRPANRFVADFIGTPSMNLIEGVIEGTAFRAEGFAQALTPQQAGGAAGPAVLGVRPEHVILGAGAVQGIVRVVEPTGHETIVILETAGHRLTARTAAGTRLAPGERIPFDLDATALHLFAGDADGRRLNLDIPGSPGKKDKP